MKYLSLFLLFLFLFSFPSSANANLIPPNKKKVDTAFKIENTNDLKDYGLYIQYLPGPMDDSTAVENKPIQANQVYDLYSPTYRGPLAKIVAKDPTGNEEEVLGLEGANEFVAQNSKITQLIDVYKIVAEADGFKLLKQGTEKVKSNGNSTSSVTAPSTNSAATGDKKYLLFMLPLLGIAVLSALFFTYQKNPK